MNRRSGLNMSVGADVWYAAYSALPSGLLFSSECRESSERTGSAEAPAAGPAIGAFHHERTQS